MSTYIFSVNMSVPLGNRKGILYFDKKGNEIYGWLEILEHKNSLSGKFIGKDKLCISGEIKTLVNTIKYKGAGNISKNKITLTLITAKGTKYMIYGEEIKDYDEILQAYS